MPADAADARAAAREYGRLLPAPLDVVILGMGEDGHTASLFPGSPVLEEPVERIVTVVGPKPPLRRMTVTPPVIEGARDVPRARGRLGQGGDARPGARGRPTSARCRPARPRPDLDRGRGRRSGLGTGERSFRTNESALVVATLASFLTPFMGSATNVALPAIGREMDLDAVALSWVAEALRRD
jgi:6-phosphogluconolactonase